MAYFLHQMRLAFIGCFAVAGLLFMFFPPLGIACWVLAALAYLPGYLSSQKAKTRLEEEFKEEPKVFVKAYHDTGKGFIAITSDSFIFIQGSNKIYNFRISGIKQYGLTRGDYFEIHGVQNGQNYSFISRAAFPWSAKKLNNYFERINLEIHNAHKEQQHTKSEMAAGVQTSDSLAQQVAKYIPTKLPTEIEDGSDVFNEINQMLNQKFDTVIMNNAQQEIDQRGGGLLQNILVYCNAIWNVYGQNQLPNLNSVSEPDRKKVILILTNVVSRICKLTIEHFEPLPSADYEIEGEDYFDLVKKEKVPNFHALKTVKSSFTSVFHEDLGRKYNLSEQEIHTVVDEMVNLIYKIIILNHRKLR
ncbi:hypothetical protein V7124_04265 [Neobacillus niacini]|uniref:hypothetical protein n=1 Tax=Neobacillus niacini TaxID=86668 RepID=UPI002FFF6804